MAALVRFKFAVLLVAIFLATLGIASDSGILDGLRKKDTVGNVRGVDKLPALAKHLFARAETIIVTETVCQPQTKMAKSSEAMSVAAHAPVTGSTAHREAAPATVTSKESTMPVAKTAAEAKNTMTTAIVQKPPERSGFRSGTAMGPMSASIAATLTSSAAIKATETAAPPLSSSESNASEAAVSSSTHAPSATAYPNGSGIPERVPGLFTAIAALWLVIEVL